MTVRGLGADVPSKFLNVYLDRIGVKTERLNEPAAGYANSASTFRARSLSRGSKVKSPS